MAKPTWMSTQSPTPISPCSNNPTLIVRRMINIGLLEDEVLAPGDWVLIHVGFAMSKIDEEEAAVALASLKLMGSGLDDEMEMLRGTAP